MAINPNLIMGPSMQTGVMTPSMDSLNGAYTGAYATLDPNAQQPSPVYLGATAIPSISQGPTLAPTSQVSPMAFGVGGPITIIGTPNTLGPASALSGQSTAGDAGVMSGFGVGQVIASPSDPSTADPGAAATSSDPGAAVAAAAAAPAAAPAS